MVSYNPHHRYAKTHHHLLRNKHTTVPHLPLLQLRHTLLNTLDRHGELLNNRLDVVMRRKLKHLHVNRPRRNQATLDAQLLLQNRHVGDSEVVRANGQWVQSSAWRHDGQEEFPVWLEGGTDEEVVDLAGDLELGDALGGNELGGAKSHGLFLFAVGTGEHRNLASHLGCELDGEMAEATDADDAYTVRGLSAKRTKSVVHGRAATIEWCSVFSGNGVWDSEDVVGLPYCVRSERSLVVIVVAVHVTIWAERLVSGKALFAVVTRVVLVTPSDGVAFLVGCY